MHEVRFPCDLNGMPLVFDKEKEDGEKREVKWKRGLYGRMRDVVL